MVVEGLNSVALVIVAALNDRVHGFGTIFISATLSIKNDKGNFTVTENRQLVRFLEQARTSFVESDLG